MSNGATRQIGLTDLSGYQRIILAHGWEDGLKGRPYRPEYERAGRGQQLIYESGRLQGANVKAAGLKPVRYRGTANAPKFVAQILLAIEMIGPAMFAGRK